MVYYKGKIRDGNIDKKVKLNVRIDPEVKQTQYNVDTVAVKQ